MGAAVAARPIVKQDAARGGLLTISPSGRHTATVVGPIHGLGDTNMGWADVAGHLHSQGSFRT